MELMKTLSKNLKKEKQKRNMTQQEFAELLEESQPYISNLMACKVENITVARVYKYAKSLNIKTKDLFK